MNRADGRKFNELRPVKLTPHFVKFAEGSVLIECGDTMVLCCASVEERVPPHVKPGCGWVTAEYSMLPRANRQRSRRDVDKLKLSGRSAEIQRLIGRSLRAAIDLEKLPFHVCTAMCVMCFLARRQPQLEKLQLPLAVRALASNLIYTVYPAGVGWYLVHPLSYRVIQTLLFHGSMTAYGVLFLAYGGQRPTWKKCGQTLPVIVAMTLWAMLGNWLYNGTSGSYDHFFNWFFASFHLLENII